MMNKKQGCMGCGCLIFVLFLFTGCVGMLFGTDEDSKDTPTEEISSKTNNKNSQKSTEEKTIEESTTENATTEEIETEKATTEKPTTEQATTEQSTTEVVENNENNNDNQRNGFYSNNSPGERKYDDDSTGEAGIPSAVSYPNCTAARAAGAAPIHRGQPGYASHLDRDGDGVGCDK